MQVGWSVIIPNRWFSLPIGLVSLCALHATPISARQHSRIFHLPRRRFGARSRLSLVLGRSRRSPLPSAGSERKRGSKRARCRAEWRAFRRGLVDCEEREECCDQPSVKPRFGDARHLWAFENARWPEESSTSEATPGRVWRCESWQRKWTPG